MRRFSKIFLSLLMLLLLLPTVAQADDISSIDIHATINPDGTITVEQTWQANPTGGTEFFIPMQYLNDMEIVDFTVSDEEGPYTEMRPWNVDASLEEKARKYGINETADGIELCFGKTELKQKTYTLKFTYTNAVVAYDDVDGFNIRFVNDSMDPAPNRVHLTMDMADGTPLTNENAKIWAFGYDGPIEFRDGAIYGENTEVFTSSNYMNTMVALEKGLVTPQKQESGSFDDLVQEAFVGSEYNFEDYQNGEGGEAVQEKESLFGKIMGIISASFGMVVAIIGLVFAIVFGSKGHPYIQNFRPVKKAKPEGYARDLPFDGYFPALFYMEMGDSEVSSNFMFAILLKWLKEGHIEFEKMEKTGIFSKEEARIHLLSTPEFQELYEEDLYDYLLQAKGNDNTVTEKELRNYLDNEDDFPGEYFKQVEKLGERYLTRSKYLTVEKKFLGKRKELTERGIDEAIKIKEYKNFLKDFTLISERTPIEVHLWDDILIAATLLGLGDTVLEQFKEFYPDYKFGTNNSNIYTNYYLISSFNEHSYAHSATSYSSAGGGGFASSGGGGGFSGGGSGGGGR